MSSVHIIVICGSEERTQFQKKQFATLQLPYDVTYIRAYTPETSKPYLNDSDDIYPESAGMMCCTRSHAAAIDWYVHNSESPYGLVMEDDVSLLKDGFANKLESVIETWSRNNDIDYISVGYLAASDGLPHKAHHVDGLVHWNELSPVWGTQAYIIRRETAAIMAKILHQPTSAELRRCAKEAHENGRNYSFRYLRIQPDAVTPILFRQGFVYPMMAIESPFSSLINKQTMIDRWLPAIAAGTVDPSNYYGTPNFKLATEK